MKLAAVLLAATSLVPAAAQAAARLDRTVIPVAYTIAVDPDAKALTFSGHEEVVIDVTQPTRSFTLNAAELAITRASMDGAAVTTSLDPAQQQLTIVLPKLVTPGRHKLGLAWTGKINRSAAGFFAIDYTNTDGSPDRMLATQFEAPDARRFAPMWDEPSFKATFTLTTSAPTGQLAFSNMPVAAKEANGAMTTWHFKTTPVMSSYLLFLGQGNLERRTLQAGNVEIGVISRKGVSAQGDYALGQAKRLLAYYNDYFGQPYPLPKMDMIAGPGSSQFFGAMENWGAIFYFENELLFDPARATESGRQRIYTVVAHEMAHQWFGDLVTMGWWDDLWLNEGFASWMENRSSRDLNPTWEAGATAVAESREGAMGLDGTAATHPIVRHVETVDQIGQAFDGITYSKGEAVIDMMEATLGSDVFRDGIRRYMAKYKYGNTATDQLWTELSAAAGRPITDIAHDFTLQAGVPLVTLTDARCVGGQTQATLTQGRWGLDPASKQPQTWRVPMVLGTLGRNEVGGGTATTVVRGAAPTSVTVPGCGTLVLNQGKGSYARVRYDDAGHAAIVRDYARLALTDRLGTLADDYALAASGDQGLTRWAALVGRIEASSNPLEWASYAGDVASFAALYRGTPLGERARARTVAIFQPELARIGLEAKAGESPLVTNLRESLVGLLGTSGDPQLASQARRYVAALATDPTAIPPSIRTPILATFARNATAADWDQLLALAKAEKSPVAKNRFVSLLGSAHDPALATRALALLETDTFTDPQKAGLLRSIANAHPDAAFDWAVAHLALVNGFLEASTRAAFVPLLGAGSNDPAMSGKITAYGEKNLAPEARAGVGQAIAQIAVHRAAADRLRPGVTAWLAGTQ
jgi:aminopeptidase N